MERHVSCVSGVIPSLFLLYLQISPWFHPSALLRDRAGEAGVTGALMVPEREPSVTTTSAENRDKAGLERSAGEAGVKGPGC